MKTEQLQKGNKIGSQIEQLNETKRRLYKGLGESEMRLKAAVIANLLDSLDNRQLKGLDEVIKEYIASVEKDIAELEKQFEEL